MVKMFMQMSLCRMSQREPQKINVQCSDEVHFGRTEQRSHLVVVSENIGFGFSHLGF